MIGLLRDCLALVPKGNRRALALLVPVMVLAAVLEALGLALVMPLVAALAGPGGGVPVVGDGTLARLMRALGDSAGVPMLAAGLAVFYLAKNAFLLFAAWAENRFIMLCLAEAATVEFRGYLSAPWVFHLANHSSELIRNLTKALDDLYRGVIRSLLRLAAEALVVGGILTVLLIVEPVVTAWVGLGMGVTMALFHLLTRRATTEWGRRIQQHNADILKWLGQTLMSVKEIQVLRRTETFVRHYERSRFDLSNVYVRYQTLIEVPRLAIETLLVVGLAVAVGLLYQGHKGGELLSLLALYAMAAFRLMPAFNRLLLYVNGIRFGSPAVAAVIEHRKQIAALPPPGPRQPRMTLEREIAFEAVSLTYPGADRPALNGLSLSIPRGASLGVVGSSGAGKSTFADVLLGVLAPTSGRLLVDGVDVADRLDGWQQAIGYVPQTISLFDDTLRRNIAFGVEDADVDEDLVRDAVRMAGLDGVVARLPLGLDTVIGERGTLLSGGQRQRVGIARALYHRPQVLVMDEATSALDSETENEVSQAIGAMAGRVTTIIIAHRLSTIRACDRVLLLQDGTMLDLGRFDELNQRQPHFARLVALSGIEGEDVR